VELWTKVIALMLLPPGFIIIISVIGFLVHIKSPLFGNIIYTLAVVLLAILSLPRTGQLMLASVESDTRSLSATEIEAFVKRKNTAIVVLGGGRYADAPEYGADTVSKETLARLRYAARLYRQTGLPILLSGGAPFKERQTEAEIMAQTLADNFGIKATWIEKRSSNTFENAKYSKEILDKAGIKQVLLVTSASHMRRSMWSFNTLGVDATPAPTGFATLDKARRGLLGLMPSAYGLALTQRAMHERLGLMWYKMKYDKGEKSEIKKTKDIPKKGELSTPSPAK